MVCTDSYTSRRYCSIGLEPRVLHGVANGSITDAGTPMIWTDDERRFLKTHTNCDVGAPPYALFRPQPLTKPDIWNAPISPRWAGVGVALAGSLGIAAFELTLKWLR